MYEQNVQHVLKHYPSCLAGAWAGLGWAGPELSSNKSSRVVITFCWSGAVTLAPAPTLNTSSQWGSLVGQGFLAFDVFIEERIQISDSGEIKRLFLGIGQKCVVSILCF